MTFEEAEHKAVHTPAIWQRYKIMWEACAENYEKRITELEGGIRNELNTIKGAACYADFNSTFVITQAVQVIYGLLSEGGGDVCEWKKESDGPSLIYKTSCSHSYGIWDWKNLEKCPACGKLIHISEGGADE